MVNGRRRATAGVLLALALTTSACGDPADKPATHPADSPAATSATTSSSTTTPASPAASGVSAAHPGRLVVVPADGAGRCTPRRPAGVVCQGRRAYRFQPEAVRIVRVVRAEAEQGPAGWAVDVVADAAGRRTLAAVTRSAARTREFVLLLPTRTGPVITAAQTQQAITGGTIRITGTGTRVGAVRIVNQITRTAR